MAKLIAIVFLAALCIGCQTVTTSSSTEPRWTSLFDGKTLEGWNIKCRSRDTNKKYWKAENGTITADVPGKSRHDYIWLTTNEEYDNFELKLKIQTTSKGKGNSGIQVRSRYDDKAGWLDGPQVDINPPGPWRNGFIYDETRSVKKWISPIVGPPNMAKPHHAPKNWTWSQADKEDLWNDVYIICRGANIKTIMNGVTVVDYDGTGVLDNETHRSRNVGMKGHICLQIHPGGPMKIRFKDIRIRKL